MDGSHVRELPVGLKKYGCGCKGVESMGLDLTKLAVLATGLESIELCDTATLWCEMVAQRATAVIAVFVAKR